MWKLIAMGVLALIVAVLTLPVVSTEAETTAAPRTYAGVVRKSSSGWALLGGNHQAIGLRNARCRNGDLVISYPTATKVVTAYVDEDETFSKNLSAGASVSLGEMRIRFYKAGQRVLCGSSALTSLSGNFWVGVTVIP